MLNTQPPVLGQTPLQGGPQTEVAAEDKSENEWITRARGAWVSSTQWFDSSIRSQIRKNLSHFRSLHADGSRYKHPSFQARSKTFRPKTRAMVRRAEAALAVAMFATSDLVDVKAWNQNNAQAQSDAELKKKLMQYRLEQDETWWFMTCMGAVQDAEVAGIVISHQYWKYRSIHNHEYNIYKTEHATGELSFDIQKDSKEIVIENRPCVDIIPIERFRFDPACDWRDPARTSPFVIYECPTYIGEIKELIENGYADAIPETSFDNTYWWAIATDDYDSIRAAREGARIDKYSEKKGVPDAETVSIRKHIHRVQGRDWYWETLGDVIMFKSPQPLVEVYAHLKEGERPFIIGTMVPEVHKVYPTAPAQLIESMQEEINDVSNLRQDTVKMSTFGRWLLKRASMTDVATLKAGVPQSVIAVDDINDVKELKMQDVSPHAFQETDRLQVDMDEISGSLTQATANSNKALNQDQTLGGMNLLEGQSGQIKELEMRMIVKTWAEPVLQQMCDMIEAYESDETVLGDVAASASVSVQQVLQSLQQRTRVRINVGFNATSPEKRVGRLMLALGTMFKLFPAAIQTANQAEIQKEIFGAVGFDDGERFFPRADQEDPQVAALKQQIQQLTNVIQTHMVDQQTKRDVAEIKAVSAERVATITAQSMYDIALMANKIETSKTYLESIDRQLSAQNNDLKTQELQLERTALSNSIDQNERDFALKMHEAIHGKAAPAPTPTGPPALRMAGGDKAGTIARDHYGQIPFQAG